MSAFGGKAGIPALNVRLVLPEGGGFDEAVRHIYLTVRAAGAYRCHGESTRGSRRDPRGENACCGQSLLSDQRLWSRAYLVDDAGVSMEDSQLICAYLDSLDGKPRFHDPLGEPNWANLRLEFSARSMCDGISVWTREMSRPAGERSPTVLAHEAARSQRMADVFEDRVADPLMQGAPRMTHLILAVALDRARRCGLSGLTDGRPKLASWMRSMSDLPSMQRTSPP